MLGPLDDEAAAADPEEAQRRTNRLHDLRAILIREARRYAPGRVLVVMQKRVKQALSDLGSLPLPSVPDRALLTQDREQLLKHVGI